MASERKNGLVTYLVFFISVTFVLLKTFVIFIGPKLHVCSKCLGFQEKMQQHQELCNLDFMSTSLKQYQQYRKNEKTSPDSLKFNSLMQDPKWSHEQLSNFYVQVEVVEDASLVKLKVTISDNGGTTQGGASFNIHFDSKNFIASYSIKDYFNGTYSGCYMVPKYCFTLTIKFLFAPFAAYFDTGPCPIPNGNIYKQAWCPRENASTNFDQAHTFCTNYTYDSYKHSGWITHNDLLEYSERYQDEIVSLKTVKVSGLSGLSYQCISHLFSVDKFKWFWKNTGRNCIIKQDNIDATWKECLQRFSSVHFFGDSQTRALYSCVIQILGANVTSMKSHKDKSYSNVYYHCMRHIDEVSQVLGNFSDTFNCCNATGTDDIEESETIKLREDTKMAAEDENGGKYPDNNETNSNPTVLLFGFGTWDLLLCNLSTYLKTFHRMNQALSKMKRLSQTSNVRWIYITLPAGWDDTKCFCKNFPLKKRKLNMFSTAVINAFTIQKLKKSGLKFEVFDFYTLTVHRNNEIRDRVHYLLDPVYYKGHRIDGSVGRAATDVLLTQLCPV